MGQSHSVKDNRRAVRGSIFVSLSKTAFISNETIQGTLNISLEEPFQGSLLQISLEGFEETHFTYQVSRGGKNGGTRTVHARGFNHFLNFSIPVYDFSMGAQAFVIQPCQVSIPFQLTVADKLPSSMNYFLNQSTRCHLKYYLVASIIPTEMNVKPVTGRQEIFIGQQTPPLQKPTVTSSISEPVTCCCCTSGQIKYNVTLNDRSFSPNENIEVDLDVDFSQYGSNIQNLFVRLNGLLHMKANNTVRQKSLNVFNKQVILKVNGSKSIKQKVQIPIPGNISLSCAGSLIKLTYFLQVSTKVPACCCVTKNIPHSLNVVINPTKNQISNMQNVPQQLMMQVPQNWNPVQLQVPQFNPQQQQLMMQQQQMFAAQERQLFFTNEGIQPMQPMAMGENPMLQNQFSTPNQIQTQQPMQPQMQMQANNQLMYGNQNQLVPQQQQQFQPQSQSPMYPNNQQNVMMANPVQIQIMQQQQQQNNQYMAPNPMQSAIQPNQQYQQQQPVNIQMQPMYDNNQYMAPMQPMQPQMQMQAGQPIMMNQNQTSYL